MHHSTRSLTRGFRIFRQLVCASLLVAMLAPAAIVPAPAALATLQHIELLQLKQHVTIDAAGDAVVTLDMRLSTSEYSNLKSENPNIAVFLRRLQLEPAWAEVCDIEGSFDDGNRTFSMKYKVRGKARVGRHGRWELVLPEAAGLELLAIHERQAIFNTVISSDQLGNAALVVRVDMPADSDEAQVFSSPMRLAYRVPESAETAGEYTAADFAVETRPHVMSCLAKTYGNPKFSELWIARSTFRNTGDAPVSDYRVRFRIAGYSEFSPWSTSVVVQPGQTVVDPFFPHLDIDKVAALTGRRSATIEIEYAYRSARGDEVQETVSRRIEVLGRNEVVYSNLANDETLGWRDYFNNGPYILAAMVTHEDPIIQQVAGWVSAQAGGVAASDNDEAALAFMKALYEFMAANKIAYQTPPMGNSHGQLGQHVKFGRDVLQNRAGTCIDLSIFYASVCQAVGLEPRLYIVPGHCYPAIVLPGSGRYVAVETTMVGGHDFQAACDKGLEGLRELGRKPYVVANTVALREQGVYCLDLPVLPTSALSDWGIHAVTAGTTGAPTQNQTALNSGGTSEVASVTQIAGRWHYSGKAGEDTVEYTMELTLAGEYRCRVKGVEPSGKTYDVEQVGRYELGPGVIIFRRSNDYALARPFTLQGSKLHVTFQEVGDVLAFDRTGQAA